MSRRAHDLLNELAAIVAKEGGAIERVVVDEAGFRALSGTSDASVTRLAVRVEHGGGYGGYIQVVK